MNAEEKVVYEKLRLEQNLIPGLAAAAIAGFIGAILWGAITVLTKYQIGYMAIAVGAGVGIANRYFGKGIDQIFGIGGAIIAILSCVMGNYFSLIGFVADNNSIGYMEAFSLLKFDLVVEIMKEDFNPMDVLFYGLAAYEGYKFSFRVVEQDEVASESLEVKNDKL